MWIQIEFLTKETSYIWKAFRFYVKPFSLKTHLLIAAASVCNLHIANFRPLWIDFLVRVISASCHIKQKETAFFLCVQKITCTNLHSVMCVTRVCYCAVLSGICVILAHRHAEEQLFTCLLFLDIHVLEKLLYGCFHNQVARKTYQSIVIQDIFKRNPREDIFRRCKAIYVSTGVFTAYEEDRV